MTVVLPPAGASFSVPGAAAQGWHRDLISPDALLQKAGARFPNLWRHLRQPDSGLHSLNLAEEWAHTAEIMMAPVLQQTRRGRRDVPVIGAWNAAPAIHFLAHAVDHGSVVVLLGLGRKALALVEHQCRLLDRTLALARLRDWGDELGGAPVLDDLLGGLAGGVKLPVASGIRVGGVQNRVVEEGVAHSRSVPSPETVIACGFRVDANPTDSMILLSLLGLCFALWPRALIHRRAERETRGTRGPIGFWHWGDLSICQKLIHHVKFGICRQHRHMGANMSTICRFADISALASWGPRPASHGADESSSWTSSGTW